MKAASFLVSLCALMSEASAASLCAENATSTDATVHLRAITSEGELGDRLSSITVGPFEADCKRVELPERFGVTASLSGVLMPSGVGRRGELACLDSYDAQMAQGLVWLQLGGQGAQSYCRFTGALVLRPVTIE